MSEWVPACGPWTVRLAFLGPASSAPGRTHGLPAPSRPRSTPVCRAHHSERQRPSRGALCLPCPPAPLSCPRLPLAEGAAVQCPSQMPAPPVGLGLPGRGDRPCPPGPSRTFRAVFRRCRGGGVVALTRLGRPPLTRGLGGQKRPSAPRTRCVGAAGLGTTLGCLSWVPGPWGGRKGRFLGGPGCPAGGLVSVGWRLGSEI